MFHRSRSKHAFTLIDALVATGLTTMLAVGFGPLAAAREKSKRAACMNNLKQTAIAIECYVSDYGQYFPCWTGYGGGSKSLWGSAFSMEPFDDGNLSDPRSGQRVFYTGGGPGRTYRDGPNGGGEVWGYNSPLLKHRTLFMGRNGLYGHADKTTQQLRRDGELNAGPVGLGFLLWGHYLGDARLYWCPSAEDMPADHMRIDRTANCRRAGAVTTLDDLKTLGGFERRAMTHGNWLGLGRLWAMRADTGANNATAFQGVAVQSTYNYRNTPLAIAEYGILDDPRRCILGNVQPGVRVEVGCPPFKTTKLLGGRALASDTFSWLNVPAGADNAIEPGLGSYAHKQGYNVLYGDLSVRWYADPAERILWPLQAPTAIVDHAMYRSGENNYVYAYKRLDGRQWRNNLCSQTVWHRLDQAYGMDRGVGGAAESLEAP